MSRLSQRVSALPLLLASLVAAVACQSAPEQEPTLHRVDESPAPHIDPDGPFQSPAPAAPENDIPESDRIEFHEKYTLAPTSHALHARSFHAPSSRRPRSVAALPPSVPEQQRSTR